MSLTLPPLSSINMAISVSITLDVISEIVQRFDWNTLKTMPLTCRAVAPLTRTRMFHSVQLLVESKGGIENEISRLQELDALFTNNSILPTYVREFEFGTIDGRGSVIDHYLAYSTRLPSWSRSLLARSRT